MKVLNHVSCENKINYPETTSEFEVQAALYWKLMMLGVDVRGEVKSRGTHGMRAAKTACRFDLVVFVDEKAACIIEVKPGLVKHKTSIDDTRQGRRYVTYGVPVYVCYGIPDIDIVIGFVKRLLNI